MNANLKENKVFNNQNYKIMFAAAANICFGYV